MTQNPKKWLGQRLRAVVDASVASAQVQTHDDLQTVAQRLDEVRAVVEQNAQAIDNLTRSIEGGKRAIDQQIEEALAFLRVQHFVIREALDQLPKAEPTQGGPLEGE